MTHKGKEVHFEKITATTYEVYYDGHMTGIAVETKDYARFYPMPEWKYPSTYQAATVTLATGAFITQYY